MQIFAAIQSEDQETLDSATSIWGEIKKSEGAEKSNRGIAS